MNLISKLQSLYSALGRLSKREKMIFYGAVIIVSATLLDRVVLYPIYFRMESLNKDIKDKSAGIKRNLRLLAQKDKILAESVKYSVYTSIPKSEDEETTSLLKEIENLANKSSVYLVDMKPSGQKDMGSSKKYLVNLNCEGQMEQLTEFMYNIENSSKLLGIEKYQISPKSKESSVAKCSMAISKIVIPAAGRVGAK